MDQYAPGAADFPTDGVQAQALANLIRASPRGRLVVLGAGGAGKTTLAETLVAELAADTEHGRAPGEPVPVLLRATDWDTTGHRGFPTWVAERLWQEFPGFKNEEYGLEVVRSLVRRGFVLPVVDGLDELSPAAREALVASMNRTFDPAQPLILTCRPKAFSRTVASADVVTGAVVVEAQEVAAGEAAAYLDACLKGRPTPVWSDALDRLRSKEPTAGAALATALSTPWGLSLVRSAYIDTGRGPGELLDVARHGPEQLREHLLAQFVPSRIEYPRLDARAEPAPAGPGDSYRPRREWKADSAVRWLENIARLTHGRTVTGAPRGEHGGDIAWWMLARVTLGPLAFRLVTAASAALAMGLLAAAPMIFLGSLAGAAALAVVIAGPVGIGMCLLARDWRQEGPASTTFRLTREQIPGMLWELLAYPLLLALGLWMAASGAHHQSPDHIAVPTPLLGALALAYTAWAAFVIARRMEQPISPRSAATPQSSLRADRALAASRIITSTVATVLAFGAVMVINQAWPNRPPVPSVRVWVLTATILLVLTLGALIGIPIGLAIGRHHAWTAYLIAVTWLALRRKVPFRLMTFLEDMRRLGVLRASGIVYQFRHDDLHDHLAGKGNIHDRSPHTDRHAEPPHAAQRRSRNAAR